MKIRPLHDRILVERLEEQEEKRGGIIIPDTAKEKPQEGKVIAVGSGKITDEGKRLMKVRPLHDRLLVRRIEEKETVKGGIIIPDSAKEKPQEGEVLAVGNGKILDNGTKVALDVKVGDKILFGKYSGTEVKVGNEELLVMREEDIMGVVEK